MMDFSNFNMNKANAFFFFLNTIKTVRNEAEKAIFIDENFEKKKNTIEKFFNNKIKQKNKNKKK